MASSKKPRKKYRPKAQITDPLTWAIESNKRLADHADYSLVWKVTVNGAMLALTQGTAGRQEINDLLAAHNGVLGLVKTLNYPDDTYIMQRCQSALQSVVARFAEVGRYVLRGSEMAALNDMIALHDEFLDHVTVRQMEEALAYIKRNSHTAVRIT
jgi:hypothetical protein